MALSKVNPNFVSQLGRKNIIINGNYRIAQRATSIADPTSGDIAMDRWVLGMQTTTGVTTVTQSTDVPTAAESGSNFVNSIKWDVTTADTSIAVTDRAYMQYKVEGQDIAHAGFGQSGTRYMTLSFWHKHTKTGIHSVAVNNGDRDRSYPMEYTQTTSDTWEKAELTFTVDTTGTWVTNTGVGLIIFFPLIMGSNYHGTANQWGTGQKYGTANQVNNLDSTSNNMLWTGVQLELGSVATDFEHRSFAEELAACQRYFFNPQYNLGTSYNLYACNYLVSTGNNGWITWVVPFPVPMRVSSTFSHSLTNAKTVGSAAPGNGVDGWSFYVQNQGYTGIAGNGNMSTLAGGGKYQGVVGTYYVSPTATTCSHIMVGNGCTFQFNAEL